MAKASTKKPGRPKGKKNWGDFAMHISFALGEFAVAANPIAALKDLNSAVDAFFEENFDIEGLSQLLWYETATRAQALTLRELKPDLSGRKGADIANMIKTIAAASLLTKEAFANPSNFLDPAGFEGAVALRDGFAELVRELDLDTANKLGRNTIDATLNRSLRIALVQIWGAKVEHYQTILNSFRGEAAQVARRAEFWLRHGAEIQKKFDLESVFSVTKETDEVGIAEVYVRLRAFWLEIDYEYDGTHQHGRTERSRKAHVDGLHDWIDRWLDEKSDTDRLRLIAGGPGSGKSSFARAFASETFRKAERDVMFIELQHLGFRDDLKTDIERYFRDRFVLSETIDKSPLEWTERRSTPLLVIFDGLDELVLEPGASQELTKRFVGAVKQMTDQTIGTSADIRAIILGRSAAMEAAHEQAMLAQNSLLRVLPIRKPIDNDLKLPQGALNGDERAKKLSDPNNWLSGEQADQRRLYWRAWSQATSGRSLSPPKAFEEERLDDMTAEPLLLHLMIATGTLEDSEWQKTVENRNRLYQRIFVKVFKRDQEKPAYKANQVDETDFFTLMGCLGLASWGAGGRTGNAQNFSDIRDGYCQPEQVNRFQHIDSADLDTVALSFFTRPDLSPVRVGGYEFLHKSFGEYLIGRALVRLALTAPAITAVAGEKAFHEKWASIAGLGDITEDILEFIRGETELLQLKSTDLRALRECFTGLLNTAIREGAPIPPGERSYRHLETLQNRSEQALLATLNAIWREHIEVDGIAPGSDAAMVTVNWEQDGNAPRSFLDRIGISKTPRTPLFRCLDAVGFCFPSDKRNRTDAGPPYFGSLNFFNSNLSGADLSAANLIEADLSAADLSGANLFEADLSGANLSEADLRGANLSGANLSRADLFEADLRGADLSGANLFEADLSGANLRGANLSGAHLSRAHLSRANLFKVDLRGADLSRAKLFKADLSRANLIEADLRGANLIEADLSGADLSGAKCSRLRIDSARLHFADFSLARDLTQAQINAAHGNVETKLPEGLTRPAHWLEGDDAEDEAPASEE